MQETWVWSLGWEDPLEEGMATHSSILAWRIVMDRGAWQTTVHGVATSWTWLSNSAQHRPYPAGGALNLKVWEYKWPDQLANYPFPSISSQSISRNLEKHIFNFLFPPAPKSHHNLEVISPSCKRHTKKNSIIFLPDKPLLSLRTWMLLALIATLPTHSSSPKLRQCLGQRDAQACGGLAPVGRSGFGVGRWRDGERIWSWNSEKDGRKLQRLRDRSQVERLCCNGDIHWWSG